MGIEAELFKKGKYEELWQRCCGYLDLSIEDFMRIQKRLLLEQMELLGKCELGRGILGDADPETIDEFRSLVPLTTYSDYAPYLLKRRLDVLPRKPVLWQYTSGKSEEYPYRWVPVTARQLDQIEGIIFAMLILSTCRNRGEINLKGLDKVFYGMAPPPYTTGTMTRAFPHQLFDLIPKVEDAENMTFEERIKYGFEMALDKGLDICIAMSSVTVAIGNRFSQKGQSKTNIRALLKKPGKLSRLLKGIVKSKLAGRPMLPKDIWKLKGLISFGIDSSVYREKIKEMWGRYPLEFHGCTEAIFIAMQTWDYEGMTFFPNLNFFEFIPEEESNKSSENPDYQPKTVLLDEVKPGNYELVITSLHGGPFIRYRLGHLIRIMATRNEKLNIDIPQMKFLTRIDDQIDIAGFTRLSEKVIWKAIENSGIAYNDWVARKEVNGKPVLNLYIEPKKNERWDERKIVERIHDELKKLDKPYSELETFTGLMPLKITRIPENAFKTYKQKQQASGASLDNLSPRHINPSVDTLRFLLNPRIPYISKPMSGAVEKVEA
ncbi:MAG: GH3 auxin-responsive promoter family protein [Dehalococcoidales bacterium]|nr:GH3 auxin-responsive promoter family protein [Dehalococcoidales bacterium]